MRFADLVSHLSWRPRIGDPSFMGWLTVAAYGVAALLALVTALRTQPLDPETTRARRLWLGIAVLMAALCINKQLDLQSLLTDIGRVLSREQGWYDARRVFQRWFVAGVALVGVLFVGFLAWRFRSTFRGRRVLLYGLGFLILFVIVRAASFHHVDVLLSVPILGLRLNWVLELTGIGLVAFSAAREIRRSHLSRGA